MERLLCPRGLRGSAFRPQNTDQGRAPRNFGDSILFWRPAIPSVCLWRARGLSLCHHHHETRTRRWPQSDTPKRRVLNSNVFTREARNQGSSGSCILRPKALKRRRRKEAVQGKGEASLSGPASLLERTRRSTPRVRSQGGPACPEGSGRTGHKRTASGWGDEGRVEGWGRRPVPQPIGPIFHCSILPILLSPFRWWAALQGLPPPQGLPEILRSNETDRSAADAPREKKGTIRLSPEPPLLFSL